ncbi:hypothetical protein M747DRAFT_306219 [Aspergillus niger ATCC 13496]|uniref:Uncharacterized protein n=3 Tax=Aspergillus niger TaxID=5061 RepID=A2QGB6_ASPNC|nr:hypothetical protein An03g02590 [Aspergillus niger]RDH19480.1 hypothetical protein M747DRAFT_306219 [Aspergillus niger ATCC 13496]CAK44563.1 hypothetical protein An03g02590 [Aspergillus niger]
MVLHHMFISQTTPRPTPAAWRVPAVGRATCLPDDAMGNLHPVSLVAKTRSQQHAGTGHASESRITSRRLDSRICVPLHAGYLGPINSITITEDDDGINLHGHSEGSEAQSSSFSCFNSSQGSGGALECL